MKIAAWGLSALAFFIAGLFGGAWIKGRGTPNALDIYIGEVGSTIDLLYDKSGRPRKSEWTRDALLLKLANSLIIAGNMPDSAAIAENADLLKSYSDRVLAQDLLKDVKESDARQLATKVAICVSEGKHNGFCPNP